GPTQAVRPRDRHVADAHPVVAFDVLKFFVYGIAAFESHERGELAFGGGAAYVGRGRGESPGLRVPVGERADGFDLLVRACDCAGAAAAVELRLDPDGEELRVEAALAHAHGVEVR